jgi:hypothetical protein
MPDTASAAPVAPIPRIHTATTVVKIGGRNELRLRSIEVLGIGGRELRVGCDRCLRTNTKIRTSRPAPGAKLFEGTNWLLPPGNVVSVRVFKKGEVGRYLLIEARGAGAPVLVFKAVGCLASLKRMVPCPPGVESPGDGAPVPQSGRTHLLRVVFAGTGTGSVHPSPAGRVPSMDMCPHPVPRGGTCALAYLEGTTVSLTPNPTAGSTFGGWAGACHGSGACTPGLGGDLTVTVTFTRIVHLVSLSFAGNGVGGVSRAGAGGVPAMDNCPNPVPVGGACVHAYNDGSNVALTATANAGSMFVGWSGACSGSGSCILHVGGDLSVTATFVRITHFLSLSFVGTGAGGVNRSGSGSVPALDNCPHPVPTGGVCMHAYNEGSTVTLTAAPAAGSTFAGWSGACSGLGPCTVVIGADTSVAAEFTRAPA